LQAEISFGTKVATLGPGSIFGELALLHEQPRTATITCSEDTELVFIKKDDFNALLKADIKRVKQEKLNFLQAHCPACKNLSGLRARKINTVMYCFEKATVPKGHVFFKQNAVSKPGVYLVCSGSVELRSKLTASDKNTATLFQPKVRSLGVLMKGSAFGSAFPGIPEAFSATATSSCEVLYATGANFLRLPRSIQLAIQDSLAETMLWRLNHCSPESSFDIRTPSASSLTSTPCHSRPSTPSHPSTPRHSQSITPVNSRPCTPDKLARLEWQDIQGHVSAKISQSFTLPDRPGTAGSVGSLGRHGASIAMDSSVRASSMPAELMKSYGTSRSQTFSHGDCLRAIRGNKMRQAADTLVKDSKPSFGFDLAMERCKSHGGHRLRAVRQAVGSSTTSLVEQMNTFKDR
jgi:CRP-like cAMP-binding protein